MMKLSIDVNVDITDEVLEYIFDCWVAFVTNDLGYQPADMLMTQEEFFSADNSGRSHLALDCLQ